jgi:hypothetical protein
MTEIMLTIVKEYEPKVMTIMGVPKNNAAVETEQNAE